MSVIRKLKCGSTTMTNITMNSYGIINMLNDPSVCEQVVLSKGISVLDSINGIIAKTSALKTLRATINNTKSLYYSDHLLIDNRVSALLSLYFGDRSEVTVTVLNDFGIVTKCSKCNTVKTRCSYCINWCWPWDLSASTIKLKDFPRYRDICECGADCTLACDECATKYS